MNDACFGLVIGYSDTSEECQNCPTRDECVAKIEQRLNVLSKEVDVSDLIYMINRDSIANGRTTRVELSVIANGVERPVTRRFQLTDKQHDMVELVKSRYTKAERLIRSIFKNGIDIHGSLNVGINPYRSVKSNAYMELVCDRLLASGFTRQELRDAFESAYDWSYGTANSHVLICTHTLDALGVTNEDKRGRFTLRRF